MFKLLMCTDTWNLLVLSEQQQSCQFAPQTLKLQARQQSAQDGFPGIRRGSELECCHSLSQQLSHSSLIIPEESKHYPWCTGASGTGPPLAPYRVRCCISDIPHAFLISPYVDRSLHAVNKSSQEVLRLAEST